MPLGPFTRRDDGNTMFASHVNELQVALEKVGGDPQIMVAGNDAPANVKARADFVCNGTNDHVQIQQAIDVTNCLSVRLIGTFWISAPVTIFKESFVLSGFGHATTINAAADFVSSNNARAMIEFAQTTGQRRDIHIQDMQIHGRKENQPAGKTFHGILGSSYRMRLDMLDVSSCPGIGIHIDCPQNASGHKVNKSTDGFITNCILGFNRDIGLRGGHTASEDMHIANLVVIHTGKTGTTPIDGGANDRHAISWSGASAQFTDLHLYGNRGHGILWAGQCARTKLANCKIEMNNDGVSAPSGATEHIYIGCGFRGGQGIQINIMGGGSSTIVGCIFGGERPASGAGDDTFEPAALKAISFSGGSSNNVVVANRIGGNYTTTPKVVQGDASNLFANNIE